MRLNANIAASGSADSLHARKQCPLSNPGRSRVRKRTPPSAAPAPRCAIITRVAFARTASARRGYTYRADVMIRLSALLLAGCVVSTGLILVGHGSASRDSRSFERSSPAAEIKTGAQAREIAEPLLGPAQRPPEAASSDSAGDTRPPDVRLSGVVIEPDRRIAIFAVNGTKSVVLSEGEALNDWRIDSISTQKVSLSGPAGTNTLKPKPDANLVRPAPPAAPPAGRPQPDVPPSLLHSSFQWSPAPAGAPEHPTAATLIAAGSAPAPVQAQGSYIDCNNPYYWQSCQEHYLYNE